MSLHRRAPLCEFQYQVPAQPHDFTVGLFPGLDRTAPTSEAWDKAQSLDKFLLALPYRSSVEKVEPGYSV